MLAEDFSGDTFALLSEVLLVGLDLVDNIIIVVRAFGVLDILAKDFLVVLDLLLKIFHLVQLVVGDRLDVFVAKALLQLKDVRVHEGNRIGRLNSEHRAHHLDHAGLHLRVNRIRLVLLHLF